ncbi:MAG: DUF4148 domain-containing protein [Comamonas sp.]|nr:DUF4148 domain-containing protein [Comamonas sp.]
MFAIRTMGVVIALSTTAAFAGDQTQLRADELSRNFDLTRAQVIADFQAARAAGQVVHGDAVVLRPDETSTQSTVTRAAVIADYQAAREAGLIVSGD